MSNWTSFWGAEAVNSWIYSFFHHIPSFFVERILSQKNKASPDKVHHSWKGISLISFLFTYPTIKTWKESKWDGRKQKHTSMPGFGSGFGSGSGFGDVTHGSVLHGFVICVPLAYVHGCPPFADGRETRNKKRSIPFPPHDEEHGFNDVRDPIQSRGTVC